MAQKVITVTGFADAPVKQHFQELEFPKVNAAIEAGYSVIKISQSGCSTEKTGWYVITFLLEKDDENDKLVGTGHAERFAENIK
ncbi:hypothetical protein Q5H93_02870 [Hymenobacter sp. ASUV-10]|uniref:Uncharacterized protein n=1 Tax=Hymenobacter aranciens TaxID=3063996 RepID=A0ABT9B5W4_9BACT|nr:hypothetical protein [Hymenobacter sp. ASUV-10]MDO7873661.1 hypothetical protein [Hymenobacter sp. ASUV-10]